MQDPNIPSVICWSPVYNSRQYTTNSGKIRAVLEIESPKNLSEVERFLGFIQYLSKFLPSLSEKLGWDKIQEDMFQKLKERPSYK
jgi:hypothetical protein